MSKPVIGVHRETGVRYIEIWVGRNGFGKAMTEAGVVTGVRLANLIDLSGKADKA